MEPSAPTARLMLISSRSDCVANGQERCSFCDGDNCTLTSMLPLRSLCWSRAVLTPNTMSGSTLLRSACGARYVRWLDVEYPPSKSLEKNLPPALRSSWIANLFSGDVFCSESGERDGEC